MEREVEKERERIIQKLKENGCRITKQRLEILDVILENHCSSCKEIFFYASKRDEKIGIATVYRMVRVYTTDLADFHFCHRLAVCNDGKRL